MNIEIHRWLQEYEKHNSHHSHNNHTHHHDDDDDDDDLPIVYKIFAIAWILFMVVICYKADQREKEEQARRTERRRRRRHQRFLEIKLAPERRQAVVSAAIATRKMTDISGAGVMDQGGDMQEDNEDMTCTICLEPFDVGEELSFSRHLKCHHCFHSDCIMPWMMKSDECPMCRTQLIFDDGEDEFNDDDYDVDDDSNDSRFRIVNGLVRFASILTNGKKASDDDELAPSNHGMEMVGMHVDIVANINPSTHTTSDVSNFTRKKDKRKMDNRKYAALPGGDGESSDVEEIIISNTVHEVETEII